MLAQFRRLLKAFGIPEFYEVLKPPTDEVKTVAESMKQVRARRQDSDESSGQSDGGRRRPRDGALVAPAVAALAVIASRRAGNGADVEVRPVEGLEDRHYVRVRVVRLHVPAVPLVVRIAALNWNTAAD